MSTGNPAFPPPPAFPPASAFVAPPIPRARRRLGVSTGLLLALAGVVATAGVAFAAGRLTAPSRAAAAFDNRGFGAGAGTNGSNGGAPGANGGFRGSFGGVGIRGTVTAVADGTITIRLANGQEVEVQTDAATTYHRQVSAGATDVANGSSVIVGVQPGSGGLFGRGGAGSGTGTTPTVKASDITLTGP
jgi:hypothetical protein